MNLIKVGTAAINTKLCDYERNCLLIQEAIARAEQQHVTVLVLPELCITGYSLEDKILYRDVLARSYEALRNIRVPKGMIVFVGLPLELSGRTYNAMAALTVDGIQGGFLKKHLPTYGMFYEGRNWTAHTGGILCNIWGDVVFRVHKNFRKDPLCIGGQICEDLWTRGILPTNAQLIINGSASPFAPGKNDTRKGLIEAVCQMNSCAYAYANLLGLEHRVVFDGACFISSPDGVIAQSEILSKEEVVLTTGILDIDQLNQCRRENTTWRNETPVEYEEIIVALGGIELVEASGLSEGGFNSTGVFDALSLGLRDYYYKTGCFKKVVLALSGGRDSALCLLLAANAVPKEDIVTYYLPMEHSSEGTQKAAAALAAEVGVEHRVVNLSEVGKAMRSLGTYEGVALQNIQARARGTFILNEANRHQALVLCTANLSEAAVGYSTVGGDLSGGLSLINNIPKTMVSKLLEERLEQYPSLALTLALSPSAELAPGQTDESDLMPYPVLDRLIWLMVKEKRSAEECKRLMPKDQWPFITKFDRLLKQNQWKREQTPTGIRVLGLDLDPRTGFRFPIIQA